LNAGKRILFGVNVAVLFISLKVPILYESLIGTPALTFSHWLPIGKEQGICIAEGSAKLTLWFDLKATWWASQPTEEDLRKHNNVLAHYINADFEVDGLSDDLRKYIQQRDFSKLQTDEEKPFQDAYKALGKQLLYLLLTRVNRLVSYARAKKGQYWLVEYELDEGRMHSLFNEFEARGRFDNDSLFRFQPAVGDHMTIVMQSDEKYITEDEWPIVKEFVGSDFKPPLVGELLAGAEQLAGNGHRRSALTEAVTALEIALYSFSRSAKADSGFGLIMAERLAAKTLAGQVKHLGLSGSFNYLLPLIFTDEILPLGVLKGCQQAILQRQNVVHNGQRDVDEKTLHKALHFIRQCCDILRKLESDCSQPPEESVIEN